MDFALSPETSLAIIHLKQVMRHLSQHTRTTGSRFCWFWGSSTYKMGYAIIRSWRGYNLVIGILVCLSAGSTTTRRRVYCAGGLMRRRRLTLPLPPPLLATRVECLKKRKRMDERERKETRAWISPADGVCRPSQEREEEEEEEEEEKRRAASGSGGGCGSRCRMEGEGGGIDSSRSHRKPVAYGLPCR